jgi:UDP-glucose 4-epimerase
LAERLISDIQKVIGELDERVKHMTKVITAQVDINAKSRKNGDVAVHKSEQEIAKEMITYWKKAASCNKASGVC